MLNSSIISSISLILFFELGAYARVAKISTSEASNTSPYQPNEPIEQISDEFKNEHDSALVNKNKKDWIKFSKSKSFSPVQNLSPKNILITREPGISESKQSQYQIVTSSLSAPPTLPKEDQAGKNKSLYSHGSDSNTSTSNSRKRKLENFLNKFKVPSSSESESLCRNESLGSSESGSSISKRSDKPSSCKNESSSSSKGKSPSSSKDISSNQRKGESPSSSKGKSSKPKNDSSDKRKDGCPEGGCQGCPKYKGIKTMVDNW